MGIPLLYGTDRFGLRGSGVSGAVALPFFGMVQVYTIEVI